MTITLIELSLYALAIVGLFLTPGPVWVALMARALSGGFSAAWPLAVGVIIGDILWPLLAIFGITWVTSIYGDFLTLLKWVAAAIFIVMGWALIRNAGAEISTNNRLTRPGMWAGFAAGVAVIIGNPKAVLFYMGVLPGFFDLEQISWADIIAILSVSAVIPLVGNLLLASFVGRLRQILTAPEKRARLNRFSGGLLILVGLVIPLT